LFAPLLYPKRVLDVGCGSGTWMREMATTFPKSQFTGIDLVDVFARDRAPKNCRFQLGNILDGMPTLPANTFDYIHQRMLVFNIPTASYPNLFTEYARLLKPGGFLELMECDMQLQPVGPVGARLNAMLRMVCNARGINLDHAASLDEPLTSAGLHRVGREVLHIPWGHGPVSPVRSWLVSYWADLFEFREFLSTSRSTREYT
ncbi:S-adenosyl-L-methionine-dependent methyltransferase, partial [Syncephalis plumigaleata]